MVPKRGRGRPPKPTVLEEELPCLVGPRASEATRKKVFLETIARHWTIRRACAAAGVSRRVAVQWTQDPAFEEELSLAQETFLDAIEEALIRTAVGRERVLRSAQQSLASFLTTHHDAYSRNRLDMITRMSGRLVDELAAILERHCPPEVVQAVKEEFERCALMGEASGGSKWK